MVLYRVVSDYGWAPWLSIGDIVTPTEQQVFSMPTTEFVRVEPVFTKYVWEEDTTLIIKIDKLEEIKEDNDDTI